MDDDKNRIEISEKSAQIDMRGYQKDYIDFFDVWLILLKRWRVVFALWGLVVLVGVVTAVKKPVIYSYSATINIGGGGVDKPTTEKPTIESMETVRSKLLNVFIPQAIREYLNKNGDKNQMALDVEIPPNSSLVVLKGEGTKEEESLYIALIQTVIEKLVKNHEPRTGVIRKTLDAEHAMAERKLQGYKDNSDLLNMELSRLGESGKLRKKQIARTVDILKKLEDGRQAAVTTLKDESSAMTLLMIDAQIQKGRENLSELENELFIKIESKRDKQKKNIADNQRQIANQRDIITRIEGRILGLSETHAVAPPMKSLGPLKSKRLLIVASSIFIGLFLGTLVAFFAEFISKTKQLLQRRAL